MPLSFKKAAGFALLALSLCCSVHAAVVTVHAAGTITEGWDYADMFHAGEDLAGQSFAQSITIDTSQLAYNNLGPGSNYLGGVSQSASIVYGKTSVGSVDYSWRLDGQEARLYLVNTLHLGYLYGADEQGVLTQGVNALNGQFTGTLINAQSQTNSFLSNIDLTQNHDLSGVPVYVMFMNNQVDDTQTYFDGHTSSMIWEVSPVPEPDPVAMLLAGCGVLVLTLQRRRARLHQA